MVDPMDDIVRQARQGSVSAIIQVLNERLANSGVRTRAILDGGVLQLLCEAATPEQLEQTSLVDRVKRELETIGPRSIRRVNINSRIVREQQLLWLQEIQRDPHNQLLWSQEITLARPNVLKRLVEDWKYNSMLEAQQKPVKNTPWGARERKQFWRGILVGGASLGLLLALVGWALSDWLRVSLPTASNTPAPVASPVVNPAASPATAAAPAPTQDPFVLAVRLAEQSVAAGKTAQTSADWLELASRWQRASDLMGQVPASDPRYPTAQNRQQLYAQNSQAAQQKAAQLR